MLTKGVIFAFGAFAGVIIMYFLFWPDITEREEVIYRTETKIDWVKKDTTIYHYRDSIITKEVVTEREVSPEPEKYDSLRTYMGIERFMYGSLNWRIRTGGYLYETEFKPTFEIPVHTVTNTVEKTRTVIIKPKGLYLTGGINSQFNYKVGAAYLNDRSLVQYQYSPQIDLHEFGVGFKPF